MRQLGDFAAWLGLILIVFGVIYYTPRLVDYMSDDSLVRAKAASTSWHAGGASRHARGPSSRGNMAMYDLGLDRPAPGRMRKGMTP